MKKSFGLIFAVLLLFFCSCSPYDPTPYIPREYRDAFLCDGSFTLGGQKEASGEKENSGFTPKVLSATYRIRQENAFYSIRYREGETVSVEPVSVSLSSPVTAPSELRLGNSKAYLKPSGTFQKPLGAKNCFLKGKNPYGCPFLPQRRFLTISPPKDYPAMYIPFRKTPSFPFPAPMPAAALWEPAP